MGLRPGSRCKVPGAAMVSWRADTKPDSARGVRQRGGNLSARRISGKHDRWRCERAVAARRTPRDTPRASVYVVLSAAKNLVVAASAVQSRFFAAPRMTSEWLFEVPCRGDPPAMVVAPRLRIAGGRPQKSPGRDHRAWAKRLLPRYRSLLNLRRWPAPTAGSRQCCGLGKATPGAIKRLLNASQNVY